MLSDSAPWSLPNHSKTLRFLERRRQRDWLYAHLRIRHCRCQSALNDQKDSHIFSFEQRSERFCMTHRPRAIFYCQPLFGIGHLMRSLTLANELTKSFTVQFVNGGEPIERLIPVCPIINLPSLRMYSGSSDIKPADLRLQLDEVMDERQATLLALLESFEPDLVIVESYPFGRVALGNELIPLLDSCKRSKIATVCSIRDILVRKSNQAEYDQRVAHLLNAYFDAVFVHSDPCVSTLSDSFSKCASLTIPIHHTGYVVRPNRPCKSICQYCLGSAWPSPHIVVSVGGGRAGQELLVGTLGAARRLKHLIPHHFLIHIGPLATADELSALEKRALNLPNATILPFTPCFPALFRTCSLSISMAGYNTTIELLSNATRALVWPHDKHANEDQLLRCEALSRIGALTMLEPEATSPALLAKAILTSLNTKRPKCAFNFEGALNSHRLALELVAERTASPVRAHCPEQTA